MNRTRRLLLASPLCLAVLLGCTKGNPNVPAKVAGKVTYKNAPVTGGMIAFAAADGSNPGSSGMIKPDGSYVVTDLPAAEMVVTVETESINPAHKQQSYGGGTSGPPGAGGPPGGGGGGGGGRQASFSPPPAGASASSSVYVKVPAKYGDPKKSTLKVTLSRGDNTYNVELTD
jgi:hypothetical protein